MEKIPRLLALPQAETNPKVLFLLKEGEWKMRDVGESDVTPQGVVAEVDQVATNPVAVPTPMKIVEGPIEDIKENQWAFFRFVDTASEEEAMEIWPQKVAFVREKVSVLCAYKGQLNDPKKYLEFLDLTNELYPVLWDIMSFGRNAYLTDVKNKARNSMRKEANDLTQEYSQALSWTDPELKDIGKETLLKWAKLPSFKPYKKVLLEKANELEHVCDEETEKELAADANQVNQNTQKHFQVRGDPGRRPMVQFKDMPEPQPSNDPMLWHYLDGQDREERKKAYLLRCAFDNDNSKEIGENFLNSMVLHAKAAKIRRYESVEAMGMSEEHLPDGFLGAFDKKMSAAFCPRIQRHDAIREAYFNFPDGYKPWDSSVPMGDVSFPYTLISENAQRVTTQIMGEEYGSMMGKIIDPMSGYIDLYSRQGKAPHGATYQSYRHGGVILCNYNQTPESYQTLYHEVGHLMHKMMMKQKLSFIISGFSPMSVNEIPAVFNEELGLMALIDMATNEEQELAFIETLVNRIMGYSMGPAIIARLESYVYGRLAQGIRPSVKGLRRVSWKFIKEINGTRADPRTIGKFTINPHPHIPAYHYNYRVAAVACLDTLDRIKKGKYNPQQYIDTLKNWGNMYPQEILQAMGVDILGDEVYNNVAAIIDRYFDRMDVLVAKLHH